MAQKKEKKRKPKQKIKENWNSDEISGADAINFYEPIHATLIS